MDLEYILYIYYIYIYQVTHIIQPNDIYIDTYRNIRHQYMAITQGLARARDQRLPNVFVRRRKSPTKKAQEDGIFPRKMAVFCGFNGKIMENHPPNGLIHRSRSQPPGPQPTFLPVLRCFPAGGPQTAEPQRSAVLRRARWAWWMAVSPTERPGRHRWKLLQWRISICFLSFVWGWLS